MGKITYNIINHQGQVQILEGTFPSELLPVLSHSY